MEVKLLDIGVVAKRLARRFAIPVLVAVAVVAAAGFLAEAIDEHQGRLISRLIETEAGRLKSDLQAQLTTRMLAIRNLAGRGEEIPPDSARVWQEQATRLLIANLQFRAIEWVEPSLEVRWTAPPTARTAALTLDPRDDELRIGELRRLEDKPEPAVSRTYVVSDGRRQVMICAPMFRHGRGTGFIVGVLRSRDLLDAATKATLQRGYTIAIYEEPYLIYGASWLNSGGEAVWSMDRDLELGDHSWRVQVWPSKEMLADLRSPAPNSLRIMGVVLALMLGTAVYLAQSWRERAFRAEGAARGPEPEDLAAPDSFQEAEATASSAPSPEP